MTFFCRTDNIMWNIPRIEYECGEYSVRSTLFWGIFLTFSMNVNILHNDVRPAEHCYGSDIML